MRIVGEIMKRKDTNDDISNLNNDSDTIYFGDDDIESKENKLTEADMIDKDHPMTNVNSVEYDEDDYESSNSDDDIEELPEERKMLILIYVFILVIIIVAAALILKL